jgi:hypothetical protein
VKQSTLNCLKMASLLSNLRRKYTSIASSGQSNEGGEGSIIIRARLCKTCRSIFSGKTLPLKAIKLVDIPAGNAVIGWARFSPLKQEDGEARNCVICSRILDWYHHLGILQVE